MLSSIVNALTNSIGISGICDIKAKSPYVLAGKFSWANTVLYSLDNKVDLLILAFFLSDNKTLNLYSLTVVSLVIKEMDVNFLFAFIILSINIQSIYSFNKTGLAVKCIANFFI